ncbi:MAG: S9 family peptidase [Pseudomonadota bacterium]
MARHGAPSKNSKNHWLLHTPLLLVVTTALLASTAVPAEDNGHHMGSAADAKGAEALGDSLAQAKSGMQLEDVFSLSYASSPIAAGDQVFYLRHSMDKMKDRRRTNLWMVNVNTGQQEPLSTGAQSISSPAVSPAGDRIAYVARDDVGSQIFVQHLASGRVAQLTRGNQAPRDLSWSPDGKSLAFSRRVPVEPATMGKLPPAPKGAEWAPSPIVVDRMVYRNDGAGVRPRAFYQLFVINADGGAARQLTSGDYDHNGRIGWSSDSSALFFSANRSPNRELDVLNSDLYRLDLSDGGLTALTSRAGPDRFSDISPDGTYLAYVGFDDAGLSFQRNRLYVMEIDGSNIRELTTDLDRSVYGARWSKDGRRVLFLYDDQGDTILASVDMAGAVSKLQAGLGGMSLGRPYSGASFAVLSNDRYVFTAGGSSRPADLVLGEQDATNEKRLTSLNDNWLQGLQLGIVEERWVESSAGGEKIQAWVVYPPEFDPSKSYPLILEIHGGPHTNYGGRFSAEIQLYAAAGYVVVYANPRGSTSYGERFANLIHHNYPSQDYDDLMAVVDDVSSAPYIDGQRLFVTGGSGGGVLTAWIVGKTRRFSAAVVAKPVINWASFVLTADNSPYFSRYWFAEMPWEDYESYWKRSPLSLVGEVETPTMLLTGEADLRTPIPESEQYYQALRLRGVDTAMVRIPGASHSIAKRPTQLMAKVAAVLAWFERYDGGASS